MTDQHPVTPPPELLEQWEAEVAHTTKDEIWHVAVQAARWGADQELEACCEWLKAKEWIHPEFSDELRAARRPKPKPKSLAEEALEELQLMEGAMYSADLGCDFSATRRALERLQELEGRSYSDVR